MATSSGKYAVVFGLILGTILFVRAVPAAEQAANPFRGKKLYVDPNSQARRQQAAWQRSRPQDAALMKLIAEQPQVIWLGDWNRDIRRDASAHLARIRAAGALPVFAVYNIPNRDCGSHSAGGANGADGYRRWIVELTRALDGRESVIILEPDAVPAAECLPARLKDERFVLLQYAVKTLKAGGASVYIDAGHANWQRPSEMASRLNKADIGNATGFSLNVSNYISNERNIAYGNQLSRLVGGKHYVIDTSRNGAGSAGGEWCNPPKQALGRAPTTNTGQALVDAYLWIKSPGESDGTCNRGPRAGAWWADYALELTKMASVLRSTMPR